tara:strand:+ start:13983 stop:15155 length:1173 start_codon:yes stop_codon:yes gene_type:complete
MKVIKEIDQIKEEMVGWRKDIHAHPELAFKEHRTSKLVAEKLESFGIEVETGLAGTGVVGTLKKGKGNRAIALRADLDALPIIEANDFDHKSVNEGIMHACGHDGHTTMLLGAAKYLSKYGKFDGIVHFIFQPAEENEGGAKAMIDEGLFEKYPVESVFGMHNIPGMPVGSFAIKPGPIMAAFDIFNIKVIGKGGHAAMPQTTIDPIIIGSKIIDNLQSIISRKVDPQEPAVLSITQFHGGDAYNVIPNEIDIKGCTRCFSKKVQTQLKKEMEEISNNICSAYGAKCEFFYEERYPPTVNTKDEAHISSEVAIDIVGEEGVNLSPTPGMGSEDFAYMLQEKPGSYIWIGNGDGEGSCMVHNPGYDFNDEISPLGASYWAKLTEKLLPQSV